LINIFVKINFIILQLAFFKKPVHTYLIGALKNPAGLAKLELFKI